MEAKKICFLLKRMKPIPPNPIPILIQSKGAVINLFTKTEGIKKSVPVRRKNR